MWWPVRSSRMPTDAKSLVANEIRAFASINAPGLYNETMTQFWLRLVEHVMDHSEPSAYPDEAVRTHPILLDRTAPLRHWSRAVLTSNVAKAQWVEPDLQPMP